VFLALIVAQGVVLLQMIDHVLLRAIDKNYYSCFEVSIDRSLSIVGCD
jgi:hypothetical protein